MPGMKFYERTQPNCYFPYAYIFIVILHRFSSAKASGLVNPGDRRTRPPAQYNPRSPNPYDRASETASFAERQCKDCAPEPSQSNSANLRLNLAISATFIVRLSQHESRLALDGSVCIKHKQKALNETVGIHSRRAEFCTELRWQSGLSD